MKSEQENLVAKRECSERLFTSPARAYVSNYTRRFRNKSSQITMLFAERSKQNKRKSLSFEFQMKIPRAPPGFNEHEARFISDADSLHFTLRIRVWKCRFILEGGRLVVVRHSFLTDDRRSPQWRLANNCFRRYSELSIFVTFQRLFLEMTWFFALRLGNQEQWDELL